LLGGDHLILHRDPWPPTPKIVLIDWGSEAHQVFYKIQSPYFRPAGAKAPTQSGPRLMGVTEEGSMARLIAFLPLPLILLAALMLATPTQQPAQTQRVALSLH
jgi:hypothetical protein